MPNEMNVNIGNSGEYFVAGELERRGFTVAVPMSNVKDFDILAINRETHEQFAIQVKTTGYKQKKWTLSKKNEELNTPDRNRQLDRSCPTPVPLKSYTLSAGPTPSV